MSNWRSIIGPRSMNAAQIAYWDQVIAKVVQADEYKKEVERNLADSNYLGSAEAWKYWDAQYNELKSLLVELGLSK